MKAQSTILTGLAATLALAAVPALAAADYYLKIDGVPGESKDGVAIESFSWGASQTRAFNQNSSRSNNTRAAETPPPAGLVTVITAREAGSGMATGRRKGWDGCVKGTHFSSVKLAGRSSGWTLSDVMVEECTADGMVLRYHGITPDSPAPAQQAPAPRATISGSN